MLSAKEHQDTPYAELTFPPQIAKQLPDLDFDETLPYAQMRDPLGVLDHPPAVPVSLSHFVDDSISVLRANSESFEKSQGRKATLRRLVQRHVTAHDGSLPRDPSALRSLIEVSVGRQDSRLERMPGRETLTSNSRRTAGYSTEGLQALLAALDATPPFV